MSYTAKKRVNLEFISGQLEEDIAVENENETLGAFIEAALIRLEVRCCLCHNVTNRILVKSYQAML